MSGLDWKSTRKTPDRLARKARPNLSTSVLADPGYTERRSKVDLLNILSGLPGAEIAAAKGLTGLGALAGVVKPKGGNWLTGSVEDALSGLKQVGHNDVNPEVDSLNRFIEGPLTKYVKTRMASPDDEVRKLAEQGVLHFDAVNAPGSGLPGAATARARVKAGYPESGVSKTAAGAAWENISDKVPSQASYLDHLVATRIGDRRVFDALQEQFGNFAAENPHDLAYAFNRGKSTRDLGFDHLIDELSNALNPTSGLPRNLQLTPEAMKQLSMEKAVRRVAEINAWRAAQKVEANRKLAEQASVVREYAENNPKGLRWVELKEAEAKLPEGYSIHPDPKNEGYVTIVDPQGRIAMGGASEREAIGLLNRQERRQALADQLKYEGDTMGHCVGGYCDDVLSGRSRIFSLRDAKGEPHVTVEVEPRQSWLSGEDVEKVAPGAWDEYKKAVDSGEFDDLHKFMQARYPGRYEQITQQPKIVQIKGKQNRKPNDEYLPFVQDFVRNNPLGGQWSDVGDLGNTGLQRAGWRPDLVEEFKARNIPFPEKYGTADEINAALNALNKAKGFASGGPVSSLPAEPTSGYNSWQSLFGEVA